MKNNLIKISGAFLLALGMAHVASAIPLAVGSVIQFSGGAVLDSGDVNTASGVVSWTNTDVTADSGSFKLINIAGTVPAGGTTAAAASFTAPWSFNTTTAVVPFWTYTTALGTFSFDLTSSTISQDTGGSITVIGTGFITGKVGTTTYTATAGTWRFTAQDDGIPVGDSTPDATFSFSAGGTAVPDGGSTALLLGAGLVGMSLFIRRKSVA